MNTTLTVEVLISMFGFLTMAVVYVVWHEKKTVFTWMMMALVGSLAFIMTYVGYNVVAQDLGWPVASGTWIAYLLYGVLATVGTFGAVVFITLTRQEIRQKRRSK